MNDTHVILKSKTIWKFSSLNCVYHLAFAYACFRSIQQRQKSTMGNAAPRFEVISFTPLLTEL